MIVFVLLIYSFREYSLFSMTFPTYKTHIHFIRIINITHTKYIYYGVWCMVYWCVESSYVYMSNFTIYQKSYKHIALLSADSAQSWHNISFVSIDFNKSQMAYHHLYLNSIKFHSLTAAAPLCSTNYHLHNNLYIKQIHIHVHVALYHWNAELLNFWLTCGVAVQCLCVYGIYVMCKRL